MNTENRYERLVRRVRFLIIECNDRLNDPKRGIKKATENYQQIGYALQWNWDDWARDSNLLATADAVAQELEKAALAVMDMPNTVFPDALNDKEHAVNVILNEAGKNLQMRLASDCVRRVFRGINHSSNPLTALTEQMEVEAAKKILEALCGISTQDWHSGEIIRAAFDVQERAEAASAAKARVTPRELKYWKQAGTYRVGIYNGDGEILEQRELNTKRKFEAAKQVAEIERQLMNETHMTLSVRFVGTE